MTETNSAVRLTRNLSYKLTYIQIFEDWLEADLGPELTEHLQALVRAQQTAVASLSSFLRRLDVSTLELELNEKLLEQAAGHHDLASRLRFIHDGLQRAVSWYRLQFGDKQMISEPELRHLLIDLGEIDAVKLWRTEALMAVLKIPLKAKGKAWDVDKPPAPTDSLEGWRPRLLDDFGQSAWSGERKPAWTGSSRSRRRGPKTR